MQQESELSALTHTDVIEACVDDSRTSQGSNFESILISAAIKNNTQSDH